MNTELIIHILTAFSLVLIGVILFILVKTIGEMNVVIEDVLRMHDEQKDAEVESKKAQEQFKAQLYNQIAERLKAQQKPTISVVDGEKPLDFPNDHK